MCSYRPPPMFIFIPYMCSTFPPSHVPFSLSLADTPHNLAGLLVYQKNLTYSTNSTNTTMSTMGPY